MEKKIVKMNFWEYNHRIFNMRWCGESEFWLNVLKMIAIKWRNLLSKQTLGLLEGYCERIICTVRGNWLTLEGFAWTLPSTVGQGPRLGRVGKKPAPIIMLEGGPKCLRVGLHRVIWGRKPQQWPKKMKKKPLKPLNGQDPKKCPTRTWLLIHRERGWIKRSIIHEEL